MIDFTPSPHTHFTHHHHPLILLFLCTFFAYFLHDLVRTVGIEIAEVTDRAVDIIYTGDVS